MDMEHAFAARGREALVNFGAAGAYAVWVAGSGASVYGAARRLSTDETAATAWGKFCAPWEPWHVAEVFGHGDIVPLDRNLE